MREERDTAETSLEIRGVTSLRRLRGLRPDAPIESLTVTDSVFCCAAYARELSQWPGVKHIGLHCLVSKAAIRECLDIPGLESLYVDTLHRHGSLKGAPLSNSLKSLHCSFGLSSADLREIAKLPKLERLSIQYTHLSSTAIRALAQMSSLRHLDIEGSTLDDDMAAILASSQQIEELYVCATRLSANGLRSICQMSQLKALDIWALNIQEADLDLLVSLEALEYLSLGGYEGQTALKSEGVLQKLHALSPLKRLWLDGITLSNSEVGELRSRYESVQIT